VLGAALVLTLAPLEAGAGSSWTLVSSPGPSAFFDSLSAVACPDAGHCFAVGGRSDSPMAREQTLVEGWNGTAWSVTTSADVNSGSTLQNNGLDAISCVSAADCWAVGDYDVQTGGPTEAQLPLGEHWDGTAWTASDLAQVQGGSANYFVEGVACVEASDCWAVGYVASGAAHTTLVERWDRSTSTWSVDAAASGIPGQLNGVSCPDATDCQAVGATSANPPATLVESLSQGAWNVVNSPDQGTGANELAGVSCTTASYCWAAGYWSIATTYQALLLQWNGSAWSVPAELSTADDNSPSQNVNQLAGVTCASAQSCWAVGHYSPGGQANQTLIDAWNGSTWSLVQGIPDAGGAGEYNALSGVACAGGDCAAVGSAQSAATATLVLMLAGAATPAATSTPASTGAAQQGQPAPSATASAPAGGHASSGSGLTSGAPLLVGGLVLLALLAGAGGATLVGRSRRRTR
jgi:hypothetical protein